MRKILRGLAVATTLTLAPVSVAAFSATPAQASESITVTAKPAAEVATPDARAKQRRTIRVVDTPGPNARLRITVKPEFGNKPVIIQTKKNGKFRTTGKVRTNRQGVAIRLFAGSFRGIKYRLIAVGGQKYFTSAVTFTVTRRRV